MRLFYRDDEPDDCRLPHDTGKELPLTHLSNLGVLFYDFPISDPSSIAKVDDLAKARNYANRDEITVSPDALGATYEENIKKFYDEHMHEDEEIRYILEGTGYFDVRDVDDAWLRIEAKPGDLLILPAGIYHRFTVDEKNYIKATRLYQTLPKWASLNRSEETEKNSYRKDYLRALAQVSPSSPS
ncbi:1,2-dihydroxy-3-keto-5-methylthiopentene dioxygenase [Lecanora helva]